MAYRNRHMTWKRLRYVLDKLEGHDIIRPLLDTPVSPKARITTSSGMVHSSDSCGHLRRNVKRHPASGTIETMLDNKWCDSCINKIPLDPSQHWRTKGRLADVSSLRPVARMCRDYYEHTVAVQELQQAANLSASRPDMIADAQQQLTNLRELVTKGTDGPLPDDTAVDAWTEQLADADNQLQQIVNQARRRWEDAANGTELLWLLDRTRPAALGDMTWLPRTFPVHQYLDGWYQRWADKVVATNIEQAREPLQQHIERTIERLNSYDGSPKSSSAVPLDDTDTNKLIQQITSRFEQVLNDDLDHYDNTGDVIVVLCCRNKTWVRGLAVVRPVGIRGPVAVCRMPQAQADWLQRSYSGSRRHHEVHIDSSLVPNTSVQSMRILPAADSDDRPTLQAAATLIQSERADRGYELVDQDTVIQLMQAARNAVST